jgi:predicted SAM-dependent methyltransferase
VCLLTEIQEVGRALVNKTFTAACAPLLSRRFQKAVSATPAPVTVNVGAGNGQLAGWINTDVTWRSRMYLDLTRPWPVAPGSVDRIYADNVIEHFQIDTARAVLRYCYDALRATGAIRLVTPDVERTARAYLDNPQLTADHLDRHRRRGYQVEHSVDMLRVTYAYWGHHRGYCFDWAALSAELTRAGFVDVRRHEIGESGDPAFRGLEQRAEPTEAATQLVIEARKRM